MPQEWYRAWAHEQRENERRAAVDARFRRREAIKRVLGEAMLVGAIVMFFWGSMPG